MTTLGERILRARELHDRIQFVAVTVAAASAIWFHDPISIGLSALCVIHYYKD